MHRGRAGWPNGGRFHRARERPVNRAGGGDQKRDQLPRLAAQRHGQAAGTVRHHRGEAKGRDGGDLAGFAEQRQLAAKDRRDVDDDKKTLCMYIEYIIVYACNIRKYTTI